jgi:hypothetical protein
MLRWQLSAAGTESRVMAVAFLARKDYNMT